MSTLYVVGIGPGGADYMTAACRAALEKADLICGYTAYIELVAPLFPDTETLSTPMMREIERCRAALDAAEEGRTVAMVCSGDAGTYGMASPILELSGDYPDVEIEVVAGITAAQSGAAVLGAPLAHDFAVVSLSDLLTPWETIERRLDAAASADFCIALYNPRSKKRAGHLARAAEILLRHKSPQTPCGWVRSIGRDDESHGTCLLSELADLEADMFTTVFIGNAETKFVGERLVTPRGYGRKAQ